MHETSDCFYFIITFSYTKYFCTLIYRRRSLYSFLLYLAHWKNLTHWGRVTQKSVGILIIIVSDNGLLPSRRQAIIWTNAGLFSVGPLRTYFSEILTKIQQFSLKKMHLKMSSAKRRLCCIGLNVLIDAHTHVLLLIDKASHHLHSGRERVFQTADTLHHHIYNFLSHFAGSTWNDKPTMRCVNKWSYPHVVM